MHLIIRGAHKRNVRLPLRIVQAVLAVTVVEILGRVPAVGDRPVAPRTPRAHQVVYLRLIPAVCNVGRVVKLGHVHVRADAVRVLRTLKVDTPEALSA